MWYKAFLVTNNWQSSRYNSSDGPFSEKQTDVQLIEENTKSASFVHETVVKDMAAAIFGEKSVSTTESKHPRKEV